MKQDKIQEAYDKMLNEKANFKYMGTANDGMADFLKELEDKIDLLKDDSPKELHNKLKIKKEFDKIDKDWQKLWDKIIAVVARKL